jgi:hypothetical protein
MFTIPAVTVFWRDRGHTKAITKSPGRSLLEEPSFAAGNGTFVLILTTATSI